MSHLFGLCCCKSCDDCHKALRCGLPSCLGGEQRAEEQQREEEQQKELPQLDSGAVTQEPSPARKPSDPSEDKGNLADDEESSSYTSSSKASVVRKDTTISKVVQPAPPVSDSPQPGPSGTQPFSHVVHDVPSDYTTTDDS